MLPRLALQWVFAALLIGRWGCFSMQGTCTERGTYLFWTVSVVKMLILTLNSWRDPKCSARSLLEPYISFLENPDSHQGRKETKEKSSWPSKDVKFFSNLFCFSSFFILLVLSVQLKNLCMLSKSPSTELRPRPLFERRYCYIAQPGLKPINLAESPKFWDYRCVLSPCPI